MPLNMLTTVSRIYRETADEYLASMPPGKRPEPEDIELDILNLLAAKISALNDEITKGSKSKIPLTMTPYIVARIVAALWPVASIPLAGSETDPAYDVQPWEDPENLESNREPMTDDMLDEAVERVNADAVYWHSKPTASAIDIVRAVILAS